MWKDNSDGMEKHIDNDDYYASMQEYISEKVVMYRKKSNAKSRIGYSYKIGCRDAMLKNIESGKSFPNFEFIRGICEAENIHAHMLVNKNYVLQLRVEDRSVLNQYSDKTQIKVLMKCRAEKYNILYVYNDKIIEKMCEHNDRINYNVVGYLMRFERLIRKESEEKVTQLVGYSKRESLGSVESGNNKVSFEKLNRLCDEWNIPIDYFMVGYLNNYEVAIQYMTEDLFRNLNKKDREYFVRLIETYAMRE